MLYNADITLFIGYINKETRLTDYKKYFIRNVIFRRENVVDISTGVTRLANIYTCRISYNSDTGKTTYLPYVDWIQKTDDEKNNFWTLNNVDCYIWKGLLEEEMPPFKASELKVKHGDPLNVKSFSEPDLRSSIAVRNWLIRGA